MADLQVCTARLNGVIFGEDRLRSSPPLPELNPDPSSIAAEIWARAENTTHQILCGTQPSLGTEQKRMEVIDYVQGLIRCCLGCEVYPYGSVPLKTYLPDGDIDLTAICSQNIEDALASDVHVVLKREEHNEAAEYEVKDVHWIDAEVKLVKCIIQNIVVDLSFNQLGGLSTLCFLEQVDRLVGKNHLFKRSIILIKAWCYYESRILGSHHGLISTYALETLVLYIFHLFHLSLDGPLEVLYRFLDYFSKFDWENYCISLKGPVSKSSLPDIVAEVPENGGGDLLLTEEFLRNCMNMFSVPSRGPEINLRSLSLKHLNIIDPLKGNNNLGRSVNRGNFYRIRSAFKYGARKLGWILMLPEGRIADELCKFFANTSGRYGRSLWDDMQNPAFSDSDSNQSSSSSQTRVCFEDNLFLDPTIVLNNYRISGNQVASEIRSEKERYLANDVLLNSRMGNQDMTSISSVLLNNSSSKSDNSSPSVGVSFSAGVSESSEVLKSLLDLTGDYDGHIWNLQYALLCHGHAVSPPIMVSPPMSPNLQNRNPWETVAQFPQVNHNVYYHMNPNVVFGENLYPVNHPILQSASYGSEEKGKAQGTGTYLTNTSHPYRDRPSSRRGRSQAPGTHAQLQRHTCSSGLSPAPGPEEMHSSVESSFELSLEEYPVLGNGKSRISDTNVPWNSTWTSHQANCFSHTTEKHESVSVGPQVRGASMTKDNSQPEVSRGSMQNHEDLAYDSSDSGSSQERMAVQSYHLKNEDDFPPLSHGVPVKVNDGE
ncbi:PAP/OAS1 substrate-binding domain superfamily protein [Quillaja saponaria]|uniref:PAP/OAS1 substrate-binding domain superfamily protein n=1 Tax=Quillaja saponaria TaxID=32244 RepID=A0AAD7LU08_QUISA|nr:PAP/OAS1 substrate-binding domain superfamily protein [Quillaja saponaria]KAJ7964312.1 PAP/OAS1 substrate-binding domain superfamily protein [Quillaja saponaria]